jgi:hypothetical protein
MKMLTEAQLYAMLCAAYNRGWNAAATEMPTAETMERISPTMTSPLDGQSFIDVRGRTANELIRTC